MGGAYNRPIVMLVARLNIDETAVIAPFGRPVRLRH